MFYIDSIVCLCHTAPYVPQLMCFPPLFFLPSSFLPARFSSSFLSSLSCFFFLHFFYYYSFVLISLFFRSSFVLPLPFTFFPSLPLFFFSLLSFSPLFPSVLNSLPFLSSYSCFFVHSATFHVTFSRPRFPSSNSLRLSSRFALCRFQMTRSRSSLTSSLRPHSETSSSSHHART